MNFDGGFKILEVSSVSLMTMNTIFVCTGTPVVTLTNDSSSVLIYKVEDPGSQEFLLDDTYIDRYESDSWNCILRVFEFLDKDKLAITPTDKVTYTMGDPFVQSKIDVSISSSFDGVYYLRGKTDLGG